MGTGFTVMAFALAVSVTSCLSFSWESNLEVCVTMSLRRGLLLQTVDQDASFDEFRDDEVGPASRSSDVLLADLLNRHLNLKQRRVLKNLLSSP